LQKSHLQGHGVAKRTVNTNAISTDVVINLFTSSNEGLVMQNLLRVS